MLFIVIKELIKSIRNHLSRRAILFLIFLRASLPHKFLRVAWMLALGRETFIDIILLSWIWCILAIIHNAIWILTRPRTKHLRPTMLATTILASSTASAILLIKNIWPNHFINLVKIIIYKILCIALYTWPIVVKDTLVLEAYLLGAVKLLAVIFVIIILVPKHISILTKYALIHYIYICMTLLRINALLLAFYCRTSRI